MHFFPNVSLRNEVLAELVSYAKELNDYSYICGQAFPLMSDSEKHDICDGIMRNPNLEYRILHKNVIRHAAPADQRKIIEGLLEFGFSNKLVIAAEVVPEDMRWIFLRRLISIIGQPNLKFSQNEAELRAAIVTVAGKLSPEEKLELIREVLINVPDDKISRVPLFDSLYSLIVADIGAEQLKKYHSDAFPDGVSDIMKKFVGPTQ